MKYTLSQHYSIRQLLFFSLPSIAGMIVTSMYTIVDGIFVSNVVGQKAFAALNLIWPAVGLLMAIGFMIGAGGSALISKTLGEGRQKQANEYFAMLVVFEAVLGLVTGGLAFFFLEPIARFLGADASLMPDCLVYGRILLVLLPFVFLCTSFQSFLLVAARPKLGLLITLAGGACNIVLDYVFMVPFGWGIAGAALATGLNWVITALIPLIFFLRENGTGMQLVPFSWQFKPLLQALANGSSEMVTNMSVSIIAMLYNLELMHYIGSAGVIAYGVVQYIAFLFLAVFFGYCMAVTPIVGYQYGAQNQTELHSLLTKSMGICLIASLLLSLLAEVLAHMLALVFVSYDPALMDLTVKAIRIYSFSFLLTGINIFVSGFFTALNNGPVSAFLSFMRTFVFQAGTVLLLPLWFGVDGIWWATTLSEVLAAGMSGYFLLREKHRYGY